MTNGKLLSVKWKAFMELLGVEDHGLETDYMEKDPEYFGEALQMCTQLNILRIMQFNRTMTLILWPNSMPRFISGLMRTGH